MFHKILVLQKDGHDSVASNFLYYKLLFQIGVPKKLAISLKNTCEDNNVLVKLQTECLQLY